MPRPQGKIHRDWAAAAQATLAEHGETIPDRGPDIRRWRFDPVAFIDEHELVGGRLHEPQKEIIRELIGWEGEGDERKPFVHDLAVNKTRQVGMTWLFMSIELWAILFWSPVAILNANQRYDDVDDGGANSTTTSLHGKLRVMYEDRIPRWLQAAFPLHFKLGTVSTDSGGVIQASAATPNIGRGKTLWMAFLDEYAHMDWSKLIWGSVSQACKRGKVANSTPNGKDNEYARLVRDWRRRQVKLVSYHWTRHPVYQQGQHIVGHDEDCEQCQASLEGLDHEHGGHYPPVGKLTSPWYDQQCAIIDDEVLIAQELDQSFEKSLRGRVYDEVDRNVHLVELVPNPGARRLCAWDFGLAGSTVMILAQLERFLSHAEIQVIGFYEDWGKVIDDYVPVVERWSEAYGDIRHCGDPAGEARNLQTGRSVIDVLGESDIFVDAPIFLRQDASDGIRMTKRALSGRPLVPRGQRVLVKIDPSCEALVDHLEGTKYPTDRNGNRKPGATMPEDNEHTHASDAFRYLVHYAAVELLGVGAVVNDEEGADAGVIMGGILTRTF